MYLGVVDSVFWQRGLGRQDIVVCRGEGLNRSERVPSVVGAGGYRPRWRQRGHVRKGKGTPLSYAEKKRRESLALWQAMILAAHDFKLGRG